MIRLVLVVAVVVLLIWLISGRRNRGRPPAASDETKGPTRAGDAEQMVVCAHCGVHLPRGDAVVEGALTYCGNAHRAAGPQGP